jgi:hypothetical protein
VFYILRCPKYISNMCGRICSMFAPLVKKMGGEPTISKMHGPMVCADKKCYHPLCHGLSPMAGSHFQTTSTQTAALIAFYILSIVIICSTPFYKIYNDFLNGCCIHGRPGEYNLFAYALAILLYIYN